MNIRTKIITAILSLSLVVAMVPGVAQGALTESQIQSILSLLTSFGADATTVANVDASLRGTTPVIPVTPGTYMGIPAGFTFTTNIPVGTVSQDVVYLKAILIGEGCGNGITDTTYYGPHTQANVQCFQNKYAAQISAVAGYTISATGFVGTGTRAQLNALLGSGTTPVPPVVPTGAGLTVALAYDNPASGTLVSGTNVASAPSQAGADLVHITFTNGDNAEVKVTNLKLKRIGVGADATLANVYLYDGAVRLTDAASVSSTIITFNDSTGLFTIPSGGSKTIRVLSDIALSASGQTLGIQVVAAADVTSNSSSIKGTFPVSGNLHTTATATLAGVSFGTATPSSTATVDPQNDYSMWTDTVTISTRAVNLTRIAFRQTGSVLPADLQNLRLYIDGAQKGSAVANVDANGYATFDFSASPIRIETGSRVVKLVADIVGGSSKNFIFSLRTSADASFVDSEVGVATIIQAASAAFTARTTGTVTINSGTITISKASDSPFGNIVDGAPSATLAKFTVKAAGERVKIETLDVAVVCYDGGTTTGTQVGSLRNGALYANGVQIGSTATLYCTQGASAYTQYSLGSALIVDPLSPVTLEVKADIYDNDGTNDIAVNVAASLAQTLQARIVADTSNAEGQTSKSSINVPAASVDGTSLTVKQGTLTLSKYTAYTSHTVVAPLSNYKLASFTLTADTSEDINVSAINVLLDNGGISSYTTNVYVKYGTQTTSVKPTVTAAAMAYTINYTLPAGTTIPLDVYGDVSSLMTTGSTYVTVDVDGTTAKSAVTSDSTAPTGQVITFSSGAFAQAFAGSPVASVVAGGQQVTAGKFKFTTSYDSYTITELRFTATTNGAISQAVLKDDTTVIKTVYYDNVNSYFSFTGLSIPIAASTSKTLTLDWILASPSVANATSPATITPTLTYVEKLNSQGAVTNSGAITEAANAMYAYGSLPIIIPVDLINTAGLVNGATSELYKFQVKATKGPVAIKQMKFDINWSDPGTADLLAIDTWKIFKDGTDISADVVIQDSTGQNVESTTDAISESDALVVVTWTTTLESSIDTNDTATYILKGRPTGFTTLGTGAEPIDSFSMNLATGSDTLGTVHYLNIGTTVTSVLKLFATAASGDAATDEYFIWSDETDIAHTGALGASSTGDWYNGYLLQAAPTTETWSVQ